MGRRGKGGAERRNSGKNSANIIIPQKKSHNFIVGGGNDRPFYCNVTEPLLESKDWV